MTPFLKLFRPYIFHHFRIVKENWTAWVIEKIKFVTLIRKWTFNIIFKTFLMVLVIAVKLRLNKLKIRRKCFENSLVKVNGLSVVSLDSGSRYPFPPARCKQGHCDVITIPIFRLLQSWQTVWDFLLARYGKYYYI